ncbi:MAG TPA: NAD(P)-dependent oxidoreductase [Solirubrobacteraceae bacterium]
MSVPPADQRRVRAAIGRPALETVAARAPAGVDVVALEGGVDLETVDFLVPTAMASHQDRRMLLETLPGLERLAVVQVLSAGTDWVEDRLPAQATLCSARGTRDGSVAEWVLAALIGATSGLLACARIHTWTERDLTDLGGQTVLVLGMGSIGRLVATRLAPFGTEVIGVASHAREDLHGIDELPALLPRADAVVVLTPLTESTRGLIGAAELAAMRDGALLVNAARGAVVDTDPLVAELEAGRLRAVLDVTDPEPLPDDHPLWSAAGLLSITPHIAGNSRLSNARAVELAAEQLVRWCAGQPLRNVVRAPAR